MGAQRTNKTVAERATSPGRLTWDERMDSINALTDEQLCVMMHYIRGLYPAVFDEVLAIRHPEQMPERLRALAGAEL